MAGDGDGQDGPALQAELLRIVDDHDRDLAAEIHRKGDPFRPYTITTTRQDGDTTRLEIGVLDDSLISPFIWALESVDELTTLRGTRRYELARGDVFPTPYDELMESAPAVDSWKVRLLSPYMVRRRISASSRHQKNLVLPDPTLFLPRLERVYRRFAKDVLPLPVEAWVDHAAIKSIECLETELHLVETSPREIHHLGTVGRFTVGLLNADDDARRSLGVLLSLANFAGLGDKTTVGMGHAQCTPILRSGGRR
jgi:CRISPR-associated endoribonuclease Cas6